MRHRRSTVKIGRNASHRRAMFRNMSVSVLGCFGSNGLGIVSTIPKLKAIRPIVERLVSVGVRAFKCDKAVSAASDGGAGLAACVSESVSLRRVLFRHLRNRAMVEKTVAVVGRAYESGGGGYVRILRLQRRRVGDGGVTGILQWVALESEMRVPR